jgi:signal transduction histidine kinase
MVGFCQDVTEQHLTEEALRESKEHYYQLFQQAREMEENLRRLSSRILRAQEEERTRISRELHDEVGQTLTAINMNLTELRARLTNGDPGLLARLGDSQQLLESSMETVHRFARELRPAMLDDLGLSPAIRSQLNCFSRRTGVETRCRISPIVAKLDPDRNTVIYRIVQESLNNIAKHAQAGRVEIDIRRQGQSVCVQVRDDGRGFSAGSLPGASQRLGLLGMQERVKLVAGELTIASEPGRGTTVRALIPLKAAPSIPNATEHKPDATRPRTTDDPKLELRA